MIAIVADLYDLLTPVSVSVCAAELEFVQIIIIIVVMTVMVVVIICLLNHYKLSTWSFITRQSQARRHDHALQQVSNWVSGWVGAVSVSNIPLCYERTFLCC